MAPRWRELREAYPRIVTGMVLGIAVLLLMDLVLAYKRVRRRFLFGVPGPARRDPLSGRPEPRHKVPTAGRPTGARPVGEVSA